VGSGGGRTNRTGGGAGAGMLADHAWWRGVVEGVGFLHAGLPARRGGGTFAAGWEKLL